MKKTSIEEKAKAYDNIIKKANKMHHENCEACQMCIEELIPELKESDDEKVRKNLIACISTLKHPLFSERERKEFITWLEKQGEQKLYVNDNAKEMFIKALERVEEQNNKGYKLTDCDKNSWWEDFKTYTSCTVEQKPAWSEEDEMHIRELESLVKQVWATAEHENDKNTIHKMSDLSFFLKTLKPQLKQEWSEEDKAILEKCIGAVKVSCYSYSFKSEAENWLKSLKPQNTWKPSDEQMNLLEELVEDNNQRHFYTILRSLYEQLKKLREE